jgi:hypothetical protein
MQPTSDQIKAQLDEIEGLLRDHIGDSRTWRLRTEMELAKNTEVTEQVKDIATAGKVLRSALIWLGGLAGGVVGLWQLWQVFQ